MFLEIGPDGTLSSMGPAVLPDATFLPLLRKDSPAPNAFVATLARAYTRGLPVTWEAVLTGQKVDLPTYPFQPQRFWPKPLSATPTVTGGSEGEARFWAAVEHGDADLLTEALAVDGDRPFREVLPALASWRRRERDDSTTAAWRYRIIWEPVTEAKAALDGTWLVVADPARNTNDCVRALTTAGAEVVEAGFDAVHAGEFAGIVALPAAGDEPVPGFPVVPQGIGQVLALVQEGLDAPLWVVTEGAVAAGPGEAVADPAQAQIWGLGRVAALEFPERWGGLVDLDGDAAKLAAVLSGAEDQVAVRPSGLLARRLVRAPRAELTRTWQPRGSTLITGGTGGIGAHLGRWIAGRGAPELALTSRSGPAAAGVAELAAELAGQGSAVQVLACDTAERTQVAAVLDRLPGLTAVVHAAGIGQTTPTAEVTLEEHTRVVAAKVAGARWLDELTGDLDVFVLFSSIAATWGSARQPAYAAGNAYLDALAVNRRTRGRAATSVAWGLWDGAGMGAGAAGEEFARRGLGMMDPRRAIGALAQAVDGGDTAVAVADVDWARFAPAFTVRRPSPLLGSLPEACTAEEPVPVADDGFAQRITGMSTVDQQRTLVDLVRGEAAAALGFTDTGQLEPDRAFKDLGFDSLTAIELRNRLSACTGLALPATLVFDHPSPGALAGFLRAELVGDSAEAELPEQLDRFEALLAGAEPDERTHELVTARLQRVLAAWTDRAGGGDEVASRIEAATDDEMFDFINTELGRSE
ncbi:hypothetical protein GCM10022222_86500 [Amycolatopsis ultiminotia]|uniref:Carrier domain-containing protein n=1 Tax=Amycolatopsis ultiminotia TaxID=543629 RepID=A0ABP6YQX5_9PSEU